MSLKFSASELQHHLDASPFHKQFALRVTSVDGQAQVLTLLMPFSAALERAPGSGQFHGGAIASFIDIAGDFALVALLAVPIPTINFRVDYLRPATGSFLLAHARVRRMGKAVAVVDVEVQDAEKRLVALGRGCYGTQASAT